MKPVRLIASADDFLTDLELHPLRAKARENGFAEETISAGEPGALASALETSSLFDAGRLVIVPDADDAKEAALSIMTRWAANPQPDVRLVLLCSTSTGVKRIMKALGDRVEVRTPEDVPPWQTPAWVVKRAKALGRRMTADAGKALVEALGTDLRELSGAVEQLVREFHCAAGGFRYASADDNLVIVMVRRAISTGDLGHHQNQPPLLDLPIRVPGGTTEVRTADLEPDDVVGVMGDAHLIRLFVANPGPALNEGHGGNVTRPNFC
jgi:hypothetical protein